MTVGIVAGLRDSVLGVQVPDVDLGQHLDQLAEGTPALRRGRLGHVVSFVDDQGRDSVKRSLLRGCPKPTERVVSRSLTMTDLRHRACRTIRGSAHVYSEGSRWSSVSTDFLWNRSIDHGQPRRRSLLAPASTVPTVRCCAVCDEWRPPRRRRCEVARHGRTEPRFGLLALPPGRDTTITPPLPSRATPWGARPARLSGRAALDTDRGQVGVSN
jgi:hypothetical protein